MTTTRLQQDSTVRDYLRVLRRRRVVVLVVTAAVAAIALALSLSDKPLYQGSADVLLRQQQGIADTLSGTPGSAPEDPQRYAETQAELATVPALATQVINATQVKSVTAPDLLSEVTATPAQNADILQFKVSNRSQALAQRLTTAYAQQFTVYHQQLDNRALTEARLKVDGELAQLAAKGQTTSALYLSLLDKRRQIVTLQVLPTDNSAIVVRPSAIAQKVQPRPIRNVVIGLGIGLVLGIALAFLREALDTSLRSADEIGEELETPLLARISTPSAALRKGDRLVMLDEPQSRQAEAFRMLKTNLDFVSHDHDTRVVMVTSAIEAEGKSTTVANLAVALARSGRRVLVADLDLRHPYLHRFFGIEQEPGVTDVALGRASLDTAIHRIPLGPVGESGRGSSNGNGAATELDGTLDVLAAGPLPPDAGDFVNGRALDRVFGELEDVWDIVLIDSPPLLQVGDASALSSKVDGLILVTRLGVVRARMLKELKPTIEHARCRTLGFVVTGADEEDRPQTGSDSYHSRRARVVEQIQGKSRA